MFRPGVTQPGGLAIQTNRKFSIVLYGLPRRDRGLAPGRQGSGSKSRLKELLVSVP